MQRNFDHVAPMAQDAVPCRECQQAQQDRAGNSESLKSAAKTEASALPDLAALRHRPCLGDLRRGTTTGQTTLLH